MSERTLEILKELAGPSDRQRRFVAPKPSDEPAVFSARELAGYEKTSDRIGRLNDQPAQAVRETKYQGGRMRESFRTTIPKRQR